jgi:uncharacterized Zn finger protein
MATGTNKNWAALTWDDLAQWADNRTVSRGQSYERGRRVLNLVISQEGRLLANVSGRELYVVSVWLEPQGKKGSFIHSECTCPVGVACKHAVAVVAEYLDLAAKDKTVPTSTAKDPRWQKLANLDASDWDEDEDMIEEPEEADEEEKQKPSRRASRGGSRQTLDEKIQSHIRAKGQEELADLVWSLTQRFPELREEFRERIALGEGNVDRLVTEARRELQRVTAEPGWANSWSGQGSIPDYSQLIHRLERLLLAGHADAVVKLGREIIERGTSQVEGSNDEGETGEAFAECFPVIFNAVAASSLSPAQKLLFVIDANLEDEFDLIRGAADVVEDENSDPAVWSEVADELARRLAKDGTPTGEDHFSRNYQRDHLTKWLGDALFNAKRPEEALTLYEQEARRTGSYERLVQFLVRQKRYEDAERWANEGIEKTIEKLPGIASHLAEVLRDIARARRRWDEVAAYAAWRFFEQPSQAGFEELIAAAAKAGCQDKVDELARRFLETGIWPISKTASRATENNGSGEWPLPTPDYLYPLMAVEKRYRSNGPHYGVLIDIAIAEKHPEEVLRWFDTLCANKRNRNLNNPWSSMSEYSDRVAKAVAESHPQRSLEIYRQRINANLTNASKSAYETVVLYLRKMQPILKTLGREGEWKQFIADIRNRYRNRPRFMEMLDRLDGGTILQAQRARR